MREHIYCTLVPKSPTVPAHGFHCSRRGCPAASTVLMMIFFGLYSMALLLFSFCFSSSSKGKLSSGLSLFKLWLIVSLGFVWVWVILWRDILFPEVLFPGLRGLSFLPMNGGLAHGFLV